MNRPAPFTQASLRRALKAAREAGYRVTGIRPDGTLLLSDSATSLSISGEPYLDEGSSADSKWNDTEA
jgi:hypothetical protein